MTPHHFLCWLPSSPFPLLPPRSHPYHLNFLRVISFSNSSWLQSILLKAAELISPRWNCHSEPFFFNLKLFSDTLLPMVCVSNRHTKSFMIWPLESCPVSSLEKASFTSLSHMDQLWFRPLGLRSLFPLLKIPSFHLTSGKILVTFQDSMQLLLWFAFSDYPLPKYINHLTFVPSFTPVLCADFTRVTVYIHIYAYIYILYIFHFWRVCSLQPEMLTRARSHSSLCP